MSLDTREAPFFAIRLKPLETIASGLVDGSASHGFIYGITSI